MEALHLIANRLLRILRLEKNQTESIAIEKLGIIMLVGRLQLAAKEKDALEHTIGYLNFKNSKP